MTWRTSPRTAAPGGALARWLTVTAVVLALLGAPRPAAAADDDGWAELERTLDTMAVLAVIGVVLFEVIGTAPIVTTSLDLAREHEPEGLSIGFNFVFAATHSAVGIAALVEDGDHPAGVGIGVSCLLIGATNLGLGIGGLVYERPSRRRGVELSLAPLALPTRDGSLAPGLGLVVTGF